MHRQRFDEWLVSLIPGHVDLAMNCRFHSLKKEHNGAEVSLMHKERIHKVKTKIVVGADGALSGIRKQLFADNDSFKRYIAIQEWFETDVDVPHYGAIFDSTITDFYSWIISKEGKLLIGSALTPSGNPKKRFALLKSKLRDYGICFGNALQREAAPILRPCIGDIITGNDYAALIGEAGGFISPSSAEGLSFAFKSAHALALCINEGIDGFQQRYRKRARNLICSTAIKRAKNIVLYNKTLRGLVMRTGILRSNIHFNGL